MMEEKYTEAEPLMRRAMETFDTKYPVDHPRRLATRADWAHCLIKAGRDADAESLLIDMLNRRPAGPLQGPWANAATDLIDLYERTGRPEKAARWRGDLAPTASSRPTSSASSGQSH